MLPWPLLNAQSGNLVERKSPCLAEPDGRPIDSRAAIFAESDHSKREELMGEANASSSPKD